MHSLIIHLGFQTIEFQASWTQLSWFLLRMQFDDWSNCKRWRCGVECPCSYTPELKHSCISHPHWMKGSETKVTRCFHLPPAFSFAPLAQLLFQCLSGISDGFCLSFFWAGLPCQITVPFPEAYDKQWQLQFFPGLSFFHSLFLVGNVSSFEIQKRQCSRCSLCCGQPHGFYGFLQIVISSNCKYFWMLKQTIHLAKKNNTPLGAVLDLNKKFTPVIINCHSNMANNFQDVKFFLPSTWQTLTRHSTSSSCLCRNSFSRSWRARACAVDAAAVSVWSGNHNI